MPINLDTGELDFSKLSLGDILDKEEITPKEKITKEDTSSQGDSQYLTRITNLEADNKKLQGLLGQLIDVIKDNSNEPEVETTIQDEDVDFSEPDKVKSFFSTFENSLLKKVEKLITDKISPSLSFIDQTKQLHDETTKLQAEHDNVAAKYSDFDNYRLGMMDINLKFNSAGNLSIEQMYKIAKQYNLTNDKYSNKPKEKGGDVKKGPRRIESDNVETSQPKKRKTVTEIAEAYLNGELTDDELAS